MRIIKDETVAVIIDIQERLFPYISQNETISKNNVILVQGLKALNIPIMVTQQYTKGLGETIEPVKNVLGKYEVIEKGSFSCCDEPNFMHELARINPNYVILSGIETHVCVLQTAVDLIKHGYKPVIIEDCVSSRSEHNKKIAIERIRQEGAIISSYESILFELCRYSGTPAFKEISKLVK